MVINRVFFFIPLPSAALGVAGIWLSIKQQRTRVFVTLWKMSDSAAVASPGRRSTPALKAAAAGHRGLKRDHWQLMPAFPSAGTHLSAKAFLQCEEGCERVFLSGRKA